MEVNSRKINAYCVAHSCLPDSNLLNELERETYLTTLSPQMISGPIQGQLLYFLSSMLKAKSILEIGTFTGYAAICLARGMDEDGVLHTIEVNEELEQLIRKYIRKADLESQIQLYMGDAKAVIPTIEGDFDIILIDAAKKDNTYYYDLLIDRLKPGGFLIADNVLWDGKVARGENDKVTKMIDAFNKKIQADIRVENLILPIRDGIILVRKLKTSPN